MKTPDQHLTRLARARLSLDGLSVGDAFGERYFLRGNLAPQMIEARALPTSTPWRYTDDTEMALAIYGILDEYQEAIGAGSNAAQDALAQAFAQRFLADRYRGYGGGAIQVLGEIASGRPWTEASRSLFDGSGSYGNGGAMRVAPLGAYFADDPDACVAGARASAEPTHANSEGQAGAIAIALAASWANSQREQVVPDVAALFDLVLERTPPGETRDGVSRARALPADASVERAAAELGTGSRVSAMDTVPFCIWSIARNPKDYETAMWDTVAGLGDRDTTCAIVGGVVALCAGPGSIPAAWLEAREPLAV